MQGGPKANLLKALGILGLAVTLDIHCTAVGTATHCRAPTGHIFMRSFFQMPTIPGHPGEHAQ
ncbi:MAG: hypothetical protein ONB07_02830 [candidate division KSB1 bacterium]|nr:hypothetical protein [candidate division KSB1 bacterium]MDZ7393360.1 hypothetical protein [candidate division KSB1 bacterium]MDZ7414188.1 hypothetical protein [candidate division KSB1 bacterium]